MMWFANFKGDPIPFLDRDPEETARLEAIRNAAISLEDKFASFFDPIAIEADSEEDEPA